MNLESNQKRGYDRDNPTKKKNRTNHKAQGLINQCQMMKIKRKQFLKWILKKDWTQTRKIIKTGRLDHEIRTFL